jgi:hypothetical protein
MSSVSHADVIGIVFFLILGAVSYYFYSRVSQLERKVGLMENILFDLKVTTEQAMVLMTEPQEAQETQEPPKTTYSTTYDEVLPVSESDTREVSVDSGPRTRPSTQQSVQVEREQSSEDTTKYDNMTYKQLTSLAREKGISGLRNLSKAQVISAILQHEASGAKTVDMSTWMQDKTPLQDSESTPLEAIDGVDGSLDNEVESSLVQ